MSNTFKLLRSLLLIALLLAIASPGAFAAGFHTVHVSTPGTLEDVVYALDEYELEGLKITGTLNSADLKTLRSQAGIFVKIPTLDISEITLQYDGEMYATSGDVGGDNAYGSAEYYLSDEERYEDSWATGALGTMSRTWRYYSRNLAGLFASVKAYDKIILPPLEELGPGAFRGCEVKEVVLPTGLKTIGMKSFWYCKSLTNLNLPATVDSIGEMAFKYSSITNLETNAKIKRIGEQAFHECKITTFDFSGIESLGEDCFFNCALTGMLDLSNAKCAEIPRYAFYGCHISGIRFSNNISRICENAFEGCSELTNVNLPSTLERIGSEAFNRTPFENNLNAENNVIYLGKTAYKIALPSGATSLTVKEGTKYLNNSWESDTRSSLTKVTLPSTLKIIEGKYEYSGTKKGAFQSCNKLATVNLPNGLEIIGANAFRDCVALTELDLPLSLLQINGYAYSGCTGIKDLTLPEKAEIGEYAFNGCSGVMRMTINSPQVPLFWGSFPNLINLTVGKSVQKINSSLSAPELRKVVFEERNGAPLSLSGTFKGCSKLTTADLPEGLTYIGQWTFNGCEKLNIKSLPSTLHYIGEEAFKGVGTIGPEITIPASCDTIGISAFENCRSLTELTLHGGIKYMGKGCLNGTGIISLFLPKEIAEQKWALYSYSYGGPNYLGSISFEEGTRAVNLEINNCPIRDIYVADGVEEFNLRLDGMRTLERLSLPSTCLKVGARLTTDYLNSLEWRLPDDYAFEGDASANSIGEFFLYQSGFHWEAPGSPEIKIPEGISSIERYAFYEFHDGNIIFPSTLKYLGDHAVKLAIPGLNYVVFYSPEPPMLENNYSLAADTRVFVPRRYLETYKTQWKGRANNIYPLNELEGLTMNHEQLTLVMENGAARISVNEYDYDFKWPITWSIDDTEIAGIDASDGVCTVTPLKYGSTTVRACCQGYEAQCRVFVVEDYVSLTPENVSVEVGKSIEIGVDVPEYMQDIKVAFSVHEDYSGGLEVEQISYNRCKVTGLKVGDQYIRYEFWPYKMKTCVTVLKENSGIDDVIGDAKPQDVYNAQGILIKKDSTEEDISRLPAGIYIVGGKKRLIR